MTTIDEMWQLFQSSIPDYQGKIWVNMTGGLDSRVLAHIISQRRQIDMGFYYYYKESEHNLKHVEKLVERMDYKRFIFIKLDRFGYGGFDIAIKKLDVDPMEYTYIVNVYGDVITGRLKTKSKERKHYLSLTDERNIVKTKFKSVELACWNPRLVGYLCNMSRYDRIFQHAYRMMIRKYMGDNIPRCFEEGIKPVPLSYYVPRGIIEYYLRGRK